jgi:hypothetical protein
MPKSCQPAWRERSDHESILKVFEAGLALSVDQVPALVLDDQTY